MKIDERENKHLVYYVSINQPQLFGTCRVCVSASVCVHGHSNKAAVNPFTFENCHFFATHVADIWSRVPPTPSYTERLRAITGRERERYERLLARGCRSLSSLSLALTAAHFQLTSVMTSALYLDVNACCCSMEREREGERDASVFA